MCRRLWANERKAKYLVDTAYAGGSKDPVTLMKIYQQPDEEPLQRVVDLGRRRRKAVI